MTPKRSPQAGKRKKSAGFGEDAEAFIRRATEAREITEKEGKKILERLEELRKKNVERAMGSLDGMVNAAVHRALRGLNIPARSDLERLRRKIDRLARHIETL